MAVIKKTIAEIEEMKEAGRLSAAVLREVGKRCVPGVTTLELDEFAEDYIRSHGGIPTFKGYGGFPGSICASINEQIVHGIPSSTVRLKEGDIISIDTGATVNGWAGDNAWTFAVGKVAPDVKRLPGRAAEIPAHMHFSVTSSNRLTSGATLPTAKVQALSPAHPLTVAPVSIDMMSPSFKRTVLEGMP